MNIIVIKGRKCIMSHKHHTDNFKNRINIIITIVYDLTTRMENVNLCKSIKSDGLWSLFLAFFIPFWAPYMVFCEDSTKCIKNRQV